MTRSVATPETDLTILLLRKSGTTLAQIAKQVGCAVSTVTNRIEDLRLAGVDVQQASRIVSGAKIALAAPPAAQPATAKTSPPTGPRHPARRLCLGGCNKLFASAHANNRICQTCRDRQARSGVTHQLNY